MYKPTIFTIDELYPDVPYEQSAARYENAVKAFNAHFYPDGDEEEAAVRFFSVPGRTEIGGNHTDHNNGKVLAAAVNLDIIAIVEPMETSKIVIKSEGFEENGVWLDNLAPVAEEKNTSEALIRGVAGGFKKNGLKIGGFKAYTTSKVPKGSGLSSSAAFEVLIGTILSYLYNDGKVNPVKIAQIAQYSENVFFGKPSGLMDQMTSSVGGFVMIDFKESESPVIESVKADFAEFGHVLCIIETKGGHADLTGDYAAIPDEMKQIAAHFDVDCLRSVVKQDIILNINTLRGKFGDRAVLRALHYFDENNRVDKLTHALKTKDFDAFLGSINESGNSSYKYLQNIYSNSDVKNQALGIGLNVAEFSLERKGACRVHGGGFAGTIQAFVPTEMLKQFKMDIETVFGAGSCHILNIRLVGGTEVSFSETPPDD